YVSAQIGLARCGPEIREWARGLLTHPDYDARATGAFLLGQLAEDGHLGEAVDAIAAELAQLAKRPVEEDPKETEAVDAAVEALRKVGEWRRKRAGRSGPRPRSTQVLPLLAPEFAPLGYGFGFLEA